VSDPLEDPAPLVRRVYAYAAYRLGEGPDAEDVTSETFARALRYRTSFNPKRGSPAAWLIGIARRAADDHLRLQGIEIPTDDELLLEREAEPSPRLDAAVRLDLHAAVAPLGTRDRELIALRYGADLKARDIAELLEQRTNAVEVALHRALERLRAALEPGSASEPGERAQTAGPEPAQQPR